MRKLAYLGIALSIAACSGSGITIPDPTSTDGGTTIGADGSTAAEEDASRESDAATENDASTEPEPNEDAAAPIDATPQPTICNVDFLLLTNSSGSMGDKQTTYLAAMKNLPSQIGALNGGKIDARFAITTSDVSTPATAGLFLGAKTPCEEPAINRSWLLSTDAKLDAAFACRSNVGFSGSGDEQGLRALSLALEASANRPFFRTGALFAYLVILDDGDESTDTPATLVASTVAKLDTFAPRRTGVVYSPKQNPATGCAQSAQNTIVDDFVSRETTARAARYDMCSAPFRFDLAVTAIADRIDTRCRNRN